MYLNSLFYGAFFFLRLLLNVYSPTLTSHLDSLQHVNPHTVCSNALCSAALFLFFFYSIMNNK